MTSTWTSSGPKCGRHYQLDGTDWTVDHCGHPTALFPYSGAGPDIGLIITPNGYAFMRLAHAQAVVEALASGNVNPVPGQCPGRFTIPHDWYRANVLDPEESKRIHKLQSARHATRSA